MDYSSHVCQLRQQELAQKYVKLKVLDDLWNTNKCRIQEKKNTLKIENSELDKLHEKVWSVESKMCDGVWDFSRKHDFDAIISNYPDIPWDFSFDCDCDETPKEQPNEDDRAECRLLFNEIEGLKEELEMQKSDRLKEDMLKFKKELREAEEGTPEIRRLKREIDECKERIANLKELNGAKSNYDFDFLSDMLPEDNTSRLTSPAPIACTERVNSCSTGKFKRKFPHFVTAGDLLNNIENENEAINKEPSSLADFNGVIRDNKPKKQFVPKQKSSITRKRAR